MSISHVRTSFPSYSSFHGEAQEGLAPNKRHEQDLPIQVERADTYVNLETGAPSDLKFFPAGN